MPVLDPVLRKDREMDTQLVDGDYVLAEGAAWFTVKGFSIRIHSTDEDKVMPPPETHKKLTDAQKEILRRWTGNPEVMARQV